MTVCIIGSGISDALNGDIHGGMEKQMAYLVEGLSSNGVKVVVLEYYRYESEIIHGAHFHPAWQAGSSFLQKAKNIEKNVNKNQADVVYFRGTQIFAAIYFMKHKFSRRKNLITTYWGVAGDSHLDPKLNKFRKKSAKTIYQKINEGIIFKLSSIICFWFSNIIICQTDEQIKRCKQINSRKKTIKITNIFKSIDSDLSKFEEYYCDALWIGKFSGNKGEDNLLKLAKAIPELKINCIGHVSDNFVSSPTYKEILDQKNIYLLGRINSDQIPSHIYNSQFILNTSPSEGLSNVFLEGWDLEKPIFSLNVNPNSYLTSGKAGYFANGSINQLILKVKEILKDPNPLLMFGLNGKRIIELNHNSDKIIKQYIKLFNDSIKEKQIDF